MNELPLIPYEPEPETVEMHSSNTNSSAKEVPMRPVNPEAKDIMSSVFGNSDFMEEGTPRVPTTVTSSHPNLSLLYSTSDDGHLRTGENVLTVVRDFDLDVPPEKLEKVTQTISEAKAAMEKIGFSMRREESFFDRESDHMESIYILKMEKLVAIDALRAELMTLAEEIGFDKDAKPADPEGISENESDLLA